jgi:hypothetical protein
MERPLFLAPLDPLARNTGHQQIGDRHHTVLISSDSGHFCIH